MSDYSIFVVKDECRKNQRMILPAPWAGRTIIEEKSDESCDKPWRGAECKLVQPRILAVKTGPHGRKHRTFQQEEGFDFRESAARRLASAEMRRFSPDSVTVHPP